MQEDEQDTDWTDILHQEDVEMEQRDITQGAIVSELVAHKLMWNEPADEDTGQEAHNRQEQLARDKVEQVEDGHAEQLLSAPCAQR